MHLLQIHHVYWTIWQRLIVHSDTLIQAQAASSNTACYAFLKNRLLLPRRIFHSDITGLTFLLRVCGLLTYHSEWNSSHTSGRTSPSLACLYSHVCRHVTTIDEAFPTLCKSTVSIYCESSCGRSNRRFEWNFCHILYKSSPSGLCGSSCVAANGHSAWSCFHTVYRNTVSLPCGSPCAVWTLKRQRTFSHSSYRCAVCHPCGFCCGRSNHYSDRRFSHILCRNTASPPSELTHAVWEPMTEKSFSHRRYKGRASHLCGFSCESTFYLELGNLSRMFHKKTASPLQCHFGDTSLYKADRTLSRRCCKRTASLRFCGGSRHPESLSHKRHIYWQSLNCCHCFCDGSALVSALHF